MKMKTLISAIVGVSAILATSQALAAPMCGDNTGVAATGEPIKVGGIHGNAAAGDFSSSTDAAGAYFDCVNANGGIAGRPIEYLVENDQWNPESSAQAASKLVIDEKVVALVGNGSFVEMGVNAGTYKKEGVMVMASACAISECFESSNIVSTNQGPLPSNLGASQYAIEELGSKNVACIALNIPNNGPWSCQPSVDLFKKHGGGGEIALLNPGAPDVNSVLLEAMASGADTILINLPAGLAIAVLKAAEEQDLRDQFIWIAPTPLYDVTVPAALGDYWDNKIYINVELAPFQVGGEDAKNWIEVMDAFASDDDPRDTFSQAGYLSAKYFVKTLLAMDPTKVADRAEVTKAIKAIKDYESDLMCGTFYVGDADFHMPNHAGHQVLIKDGGFEIVRECFEFESPYFEPIRALEEKLGVN